MKSDEPCSIRHLKKYFQGFRVNFQVKKILKLKYSIVNTIKISKCKKRLKAEVNHAVNTHLEHYLRNIKVYPATHYC